jgi:hypothetical protein
MGDKEIYHVIMSLMITAIVIIIIMFTLFAVYHLYWWYQRRKQNRKDDDGSTQGLLYPSDEEAMIGGELGDELDVLSKEETTTLPPKESTDKID